MGSSIPILDFVPVGFRFRPTDEELVGHYLNHKLLGNDSMVNSVIAEVDVCKFEPWELPVMISEFSALKSDDPEWFNRKTKCGFWKPTGNDRNIKTRGTDNVIGTKKTLVFHKGPVPGVKTKWVIHEYQDAVTFDESQVGGISPDINMELNFQPTHREDIYFPSSTQQTPIGIEQGVSFPNSPSANAYFGNENHIIQTPFETTEEEDELNNSMLINEDSVINDKIGHAFDNGPAQSESLRSFYYDNSDTDVEVVSALVMSEMNMESIFQATHQADIYFPSSTQQSPIGIEQGVSFPNSPSANAYFGNENHFMQTPFETTEEEDKFINSMLINEGFVINEKRGHAFDNGPAQSESLRRVYYDSSDTDAEVVSTRVMPEMNMESNFQATHQVDIYFPSSTQQSPIDIEQGVSFPNSPSANAYFGI